MADKSPGQVPRIYIAVMEQCLMPVTFWQSSPSVERNASDPGVMPLQGSVVSSINGASIADGGLHKDAVCTCQQLLPAGQGVLDLLL